MASSTVLACFGAGSLKLGTPLDTASTPVRAVQPEAKALRTRITIDWVAVVKPGRVMFEIAGVPEDAAQEALRLASHKLPIRTKVLKREEAEGDAE